MSASTEPTAITPLSTRIRSALRSAASESSDAVRGVAAVVRPRERGDRGHAVLAEPLALRDRGPRQQPLELAAGIVGAPEQRRELVRLQPRRVVGLLWRQRGRRLARQRRALLGPTGEHQRAREQPRHVRARRGIVRRVVGDPEPRGAGRPVDVGLGAGRGRAAPRSPGRPAAARPAPAAGRRRRCRPRPCAIAAAPARSSSSATHGAPRRGVASSCAATCSVSAPAARSAWAGALVRQLALARRQLVVDGVADERVHERRAAARDARSPPARARRRRPRPRARRAPRAPPRPAARRSPRAR